MKFWQVVIAASLTATLVRLNSANMSYWRDVLAFMMFVAVHGLWWFTIDRWVYASDSDGSGEAGETAETGSTRRARARAEGIAK